ncbi:uncharacterized protein TNCV_4340121 [Trichonephila clavipes]|nr:uncharacterized protein TNCV_4340121 [Trichonephila clavipes]
MRQIGRGFSAGFKLCSTFNLPRLSKTAYATHEDKLMAVISEVSELSMQKAASELLMLHPPINKIVECGVSVDGTWQRRGYTSMNGCVAALSVDTGLEYAHYYGDGDSKGFISVKDTYGKNSVTKYECIGHVQKRVGARLRKLKSKNKNLSGKGKLTDSFIDRLQNYYGIAVRSNIGNLSGLQQNVIAALLHCSTSVENRWMGPSEKIVGAATSGRCLAAKSRKKNIKTHQMKHD